jgi:HPt (histidine-containing phosphotransfer) domain-containing protein
MRILSLIVLLATFLGLVPAQAADHRAGCDSCSIRVDSLDQPTRLVGQWLFTRDDAPANAAADLDTSDTASWRLVKAPGPWKHAYGDGRNFDVGWYRGAFDFAPALVGQEAVVLVNAYMGKVRVFIDGKEVYERPENANVQRYYSIQPIPVRFTIAQPHQTIAIRVETPLMTGIYMLPFELRKYDAHDASLVFYQAWGGELRLVTGVVVAFFGLFFLLVFAKVRHPLYLVAALASLTIVPFFVAPADFLVALFGPERLTYIHYFGLFSGFFCYLFTQFFHKFTPRVNWVVGAAMGAIALLITSMAVHPNLELFQHVRAVYFLMMLGTGLGGLYMLVNGVRSRKPGAGVLLAGLLLFVAAGVNDLLLALGAVATISLIFTGLAVFIGTILVVASNSFANTFLENKRLVTELKGMNENLEGLVAERTLALRQKTHDIQGMLQNMPQGVLTIVAGNTVHPEYSAYLETIFETRAIANRGVMALVFGNCSLGADALSSIDATISSCIGEDTMNYEFNSHLLATEIEATMPDGRRKALELSWSPISGEGDVVEKLMVCVRDVTELKRLAHEASAQRRELEIIGEILAVSQEKFQDFMQSSLAFVEENRQLTETAAGPSDELVAQLFRNMHTVKGNARTYGLGNLTSTVHEAEQGYDDLRKGVAAAWCPAELLGRLDRVRALLEEYAKINDHTLGRKGPGRRGGVEKYLMVDRGQVARTLQAIENVDTADADAMRDALAQTRMLLRRIGTERLQEVLAGVADSLPSLATELGKPAPEVVIADNGLVVRSQVAGLLKNLFTHLMRNAVDHGIESPAARAAAGKPAAGRIELVLGADAEAFTMTLRDDGQGMALRRIREIATERGLLAPDAQPSDEETANLVFLPGFSTATQVTEVSGRGVGMDAVQAFLEREGGRIDVRFLGATRPSGHRPFEFVITLPAAIAVRVGEPGHAAVPATPADPSPAAAGDAARASAPALDEAVGAR